MNKISFGLVVNCYKSKKIRIEMARYITSLNTFPFLFFFMLVTDQNDIKSILSY